MKNLYNPHKKSRIRIATPLVNLTHSFIVDCADKLLDSTAGRQSTQDDGANYDSSTEEPDKQEFYCNMD